MTSQRLPSWAALVAMLGACLLLTACGQETNQTGAQLLGLAVDGELPIDATKLPISATMPAETALALSAILGQALGGAQANNSVIAVTKRPDHIGHDAVLIIDGGLGDDSIRGYRYTLPVHATVTTAIRRAMAGSARW